jgi:membrane associated rhomboid family serine protease
MQAVPARATLMLVGATVAAWLVMPLIGAERAAYLGGFIPARVSGVALPGALPVWITPLSATFLHSGALHLGFNMLMLGYCGRYVELALRPAGLIILYVVGAFAAALCQYAVGPTSIVPMIGASGAISALVGTYAILYGQRQASLAATTYGRLLHVLWLAGAWIFVQLLIGIASAASHMAIAVAAHIGGFLAGLVLARPLLLWRYRRA